jgi:hypothetical protein
MAHDFTGKIFGIAAVGQPLAAKPEDRLNVRQDFVFVQAVAPLSS